MAAFTVRVEFHSPDNGDYEKLHTAMMDHGFARTIVVTNAKYYLPTAEYITTADVTASQVLDAAKAAAATVGKTAAVLVTQATDWALDGLAEA